MVVITSSIRVARPLVRLSGAMALILAGATTATHARPQATPAAVSSHVAPAAPVPTADAQLAAAVDRARRENKAVFVDFGASWCGPCLALEALLNAPEIRPALDPSFVIVRMTAWEHGDKEALNNPGADELMDRLGGGTGIPFYAVLDATGRLVASDTGYPSDSASMESFLQLIARGAPRMSPEAHLTLSTYLDRHANGLGSIAGTVRGKDGHGLAGAAVSIVGRAFVNGQWVPARMQTIRADTHGRYVIDGVPAGTYRLLVEGPVMGFYPAAASPSDATSVEIGRGQGVTGLDISLPPPPDGRLAGRIATSAGAAASGVSVTLTNREWLGMTYTTTSGTDGAFTVERVPPGTYALWAHAADGTAWATDVVTVAARATADIAIHMRPPGLVSGRVQIEHEAASSANIPAHIAIAAVPVPVQGVPLATVRTPLAADGTFRMAGLSGQRVIRVEGLPAGWTLARVVQRGGDITDRGTDFSEVSARGDLEVLLARQAGAISGRVETTDGEPVTAGAVVVFAEDPARWAFPSRFLRFAPVQPDGSYAVEGLSPGTYLVSAVPSLAPDWQAPETLERLRSSAVRVTIEHSERQTVGLRAGTRH
jgi:thiol-disulfide isomerase/thioredoxin